MSSFHDSDICRSIIDSLPTGLWVVDMQKRIVFWSDGAERITGHPRHEVIGHCCITEALLHCEQPGCEFCHADCPVAHAIKTAHPAESIGFHTTKPVMKFLFAQQSMKQMADFDRLKSHIEMTVTAECLRIELSESANGTFFDSGSAKLNANGCEDAHHPRAGIGQPPTTSSPLNVTPIPSLTLRLPRTVIGNCPPIAPMPPAVSCRPTESGLTR